MGPLIVALLSWLIPFPGEEDALRVLIGLARGLDIPRDWHLVDGGEEGFERLHFTQVCNK